MGTFRNVDLVAVKSRCGSPASMGGARAACGELVTNGARMPAHASLTGVPNQSSTAGF